MEQLADQLEVYCQPIYAVRSLQDYTVKDYEILLRHRGGRPLQTQEIIALTGNYQSRHELREWLLANLARLAKARPEITVNVNLDPWQFNYQDVWPYLTALRRAISNVNIEITERNNFQAEDTERFASLLARIQDHGFRISLDDVGSGYNSLQTVISNSPYLDRIKFSLLIFQNRDHLNMLHFAHAWYELASSRELELVVEGMEDRLTAQQLVKRGCTLQQGFLWQRPMPLAKLLEKK